MKFKLWVLRMLGIDHGPWMIPVRAHWIFVDIYQQIWKIEYTNDHNNPFIITLVER